MIDKQCPLCGNPINESESLCANCWENTEKRDAVDFLVDENNEPVPTGMEGKHNSDNIPENETSTQPSDEPSNKVPRNNKKLLIIFFSGIFICVVIGIVAFVVNKNIRQDKEAELNFWFDCIEENTPVAYSKYLLVYPEGKFSQEAHIKITELRKKELSEWEELRKSPDITRFQRFTDLYPDTPFKNEIAKIMDSLSWEEAVGEHTAESYLFYLENARLGNISGYYKGVAQQRYDYLSKIKELDENELEQIEKTIHVFFNTLSAKNEKKLLELFNNPIANFYGAKNHPSEAIISTIVSDIKKNNIKNIIYTPELSTIKAFKEGDELYVTELEVVKKIVYANKKKDETIDEKLHIDITPGMKIKSMYAIKDTASESNSSNQ